MAYAARYGHQQLAQIKEMTSDEIKDFNDALYYWIDRENSSAREER